MRARKSPISNLQLGKWNWLPDTILFFFFLVLYSFTSARDVLPADAGEFQIVVPLLGVAHPPGFVLYTILGKTFISILAVGPPALRLNLFSAFTGAITLFVVSRTVKVLARNRLNWPGLLVGAALGVSTTFWAQSTSANIRSLTGLFTALTIWSFVLCAERGADDRNFARFIFLLALGIVHHASLIFVGIVLLLGVQFFDARLALQPQRWWQAALLGLAPLLVLIYLPLRGAAGAALAPAHLNTWSGFLEHVLARGFEGNFFFFATAAAFPDRLPILVNIAVFQFGNTLLVLGGIALLLVVIFQRRIGAILIFAIVVHALISITYGAPQTVEYLLPAYIVAAIAAGAGLAHLHGFALRQSSRILRLTPYVFGFFAIVAILSLGARNFRAYATLASDTSTREFAGGLLNAAPADAVIFANWHWATPMWYLQQVEGLRPDVEVIYVFPQGDSLAQTWLDRLDENVPERPTLVTNYYATEYAASDFWFAPYGPGWLVSENAPEELPTGMTKLAERFGDHWLLRGYHADTRNAVPGDAINVEAAWQTNGPPEDITFFVQLLRADGVLYGQADQSFSHKNYNRDDLMQQRYTLSVSAPAQPGEYALVAGVVKPDGVRYTQPGGAEFIQLGTITISPRPAPPPTTRRTRNIGSTLYGYDFDATLPGEFRLFLHWRLEKQPQEYVVWLQGSPFQTVTLPAGEGYLTTTTDLPAHADNLQIVRGNGTPALLSVRLDDPAPSNRYVPLGGALVLTRAQTRAEDDGSLRVDLTWQAARPLTEDDIIKVDLIGPDYAWRVQSDHVPAGGAIPTLKWIPGPAIHDRHRLTPPVGADLTKARLELAVYDHFTGHVLPIGDPRLAQLGETVEIIPSR